MEKVNRGPQEQVDLSTVRRSSRVADKLPQACKELQKKLIFQTSGRIFHDDIIGTENDSLDRSSTTRIDNPSAESEHYGNIINNIIVRHPQITDAFPTLNIQTQRHEEPEQEKTRNRFPLSALLEVGSQSDNHPLPLQIETDKWYLFTSRYKKHANDSIINLEATCHEKVIDDNCGFKVASKRSFIYCQRKSPSGIITMG
ncbi:hypothetical protein Tco_1030897 [Tanacetum coccineum]|uniref:Uncharacterized protein n=1 Tax=Tanacetum coccineum TaxID=301880 RepID=A0ABQ5G7I3_9ASTR